MTKRIPQPRSELSPAIRAHEAQLLAVMLRTSRLTCVFGEPGTDKSALLKTGVLPLLRRRLDDRAPAAQASSLPRAGLERRRAVLSAGARRLEAALYFDLWGDTPLADLKVRLVDLVPVAQRGRCGAAMPLAELLDSLGAAGGFHFFVLFDRFEEFLALPPDQGERGAFLSEWVDTLLRPRMPASFLVALDEDARPRLERLRARVPGFDHNSLRLSPVAPVPPEPPAPPSLIAAARPQAVPPDTAPRASPVELRFVPSKRKPQRREPPSRVPIKVEDVYAFIEAKLSKTTAQRDPADDKPPATA